jgi:signal transduction histidine kinase
MKDAMAVSMTLGLISAVAMLIQLLIFVYLYRSHRSRFFGYLVWAWACFVVWKILNVTLQISGASVGLAGALMNGSGVTGDFLVLAAGFAFRNDYRIRWRHATLAGAYVLVAAVFGNPASSVTGVPTSEGCITGGALILGGLAFWPRRGAVAIPRGSRFLAVSLTLWGLHRVVTPFVAGAADSLASVATSVTFVLFYFLTVFGIIIVVLDRARVEAESLREFNERLVHGLGEGLTLVDGAYTVRHANRWMAQRFGTVVGRRCHEVVAADGQPCPGCPLGRRESLDTPALVQIAGAGDRRLVLTCSPVRQPDGRVFLLELVADVTEQERLRARLAEAEQLAAAGELAAGVAHEIRNPLAAIVNATTLLERPDVLSADERAGTLGAIKKEARRLNAILSDFLAFAGPREPKPVTGDIRTVIEHVAALIREEHGRGDALRVEVTADPTLTPFAFDADQLTQVLWNIARNGVAAMDGRGRLALDVAREDGEVRITVADEGPGIPAEAQRRIFQPFYSSRPGGTGLGLAIANRIVTAHGGRIELTSGPARGSRFTVCLPLERG